VWAESFEEACDQFVACLRDIHDGLELHLDEQFGDEVLYPDSDAMGEIDPTKVLLEDVTEDDEQHELSGADDREGPSEPEDYGNEI
jgi:hypothetical protein